jgi:hypothetical protein
MTPSCTLSLTDSSIAWLEFFGGLDGKELMACRQKLSRALTEHTEDPDIERILGLARAEESIRWETELMVSTAVNERKLL